MTPTADRLPLLRPGTHFTPDDGACLMELVSLLAGEPFSDAPACTDATLTTIARVVNDETSDPARQSLAPLAVDLIARTGDPAHLAPHLVHVSLTTAQQHLPAPSPTLERHRRRAAHRLNNPHRPVLPARLYARGPAQHALTAMTLALRALPPAPRDLALHAVLHAAITATPRPVTSSRTPHDTGRVLR